MSCVRSSFVLSILLSAVFLNAQVGKMVIAAGSPEDKALQAISNEQDSQKKLSLYLDFVQTFAANPADVAYGNWQLAQYYQTAGDPQKAIEYGDKALAGSPGDLDILVMQATLAQQLKNGGKVIDYATQGGATYNAIGKQPKPDGVSDADFAARVQQDKDSEKSSYEFLEAAGFDSIASENNPKTRMFYIERFTPAFPDSRFADSIGSYAMISLSQLNDMPRLVAYADKSLAANPDSLPTLLLLANAYADDPKPGSTAKAVTYAQKAIAVAKADAPDADHSRKLSAGVAHSTLGYAYMKQDKTQAAIPELKTAAAQLKGGDDQSYAVALYRLGFAYAKLSKISDARAALMEAVKFVGPVQQPAQDLLSKVNAARAKGQ
jgi:tetratricopeptide (TPR) repeat protein